MNQYPMNDLRNPLGKAFYDLTQQVEALGGSPELTDVVVAIGALRDQVGAALATKPPAQDPIGHVERGMLVRSKISPEYTGPLYTAPQPPAGEQKPDMRAICEALGFDPTNHHNAAKCPYCRPAQPEQVAQDSDLDEKDKEIARLRALLEINEAQHSHECRSCHLRYTPEENEDCPSCGFNGIDTERTREQGGAV